MNLLSSAVTVTHPQFPVLSKGLPLLSTSLYPSFYPADPTVNGQQQRGGRNRCLKSILVADPKSCYPPSSFASPSSPLAGRRAVTGAGIYAARKWRPFRRRKTQHGAQKFLHLLVYLHRSWPLLLLQEGLQAGVSSVLLGSEDERLRRLLLGLITAGSGGRRRKRRGFRIYLALASLVALVASVFVLLLLSQGNAANLSSVLPPIVMRRLREVASMFSFAFRRRGAW
ncbi:uncharacterized protein LOC116258581 [Nymphaea colorata]|uniref:uncharacterized protein LOC116258581 n=1 Tax=Nymphaea colorata TaxID=210225 RepID=UPI00129DDE4A|nr:uncharacterized protein LOC116258581 [Nymphaea colorata]